MLDLSAAPVGADVLAGVGDFYLLDNTRVAVVRYDPSGAFVRAELVDEPIAGIYRAAAHAACPR